MDSLASAAFCRLLVCLKNKFLFIDYSCLDETKQQRKKHAKKYSTKCRNALFLKYYSQNTNTHPYVVTHIRSFIFENEPKKRLANTVPRNKKTNAKNAIKVQNTLIIWFLLT